ncbi:hypothetical protein RRF68_04775 [Tenacibaculum sp. HL-MS23]|uniref:hypothetical protein n=1 Tax=unclassified Tenacibaculum TaxID=2635139 RepID=UPI001C4F1698|nr:MULTISPECIES: hypothetical protein [unclassified Tenacibaculum]QXP74640.1 hypothetical protein H0I30_05815 [Tenacibaculum sp. AHE14PA]QXP76151.1 hypothetical protein H0I31_00555 [Tenacibaculum sp. AHE15PA]WNW02728.1 hypothetical protein RRF68_04775 [Tenacibaculum sp. HL-MS23]
MSQNLKHIFSFFILLFCFVSSSFAQEVKVIDNKGTISNIKNTRVFTGTKPADTDAVTGDIYFDTYPNPTLIEIWDGDNTEWRSITIDNTHTGATGSVFFANTDGTPTENNSQFFFNNTNNRFGIGTNTPTNKLQVSGAIRSAGMLNSDGNVGEPAYRFNDDTDTGMYSPFQDDISFAVGGIEAINIEETSNVTKVTIKENLELDGTLLDINNNAGTAGQILSSTATGTDWIDNTNTPNTVTESTNVTARTPATFAFPVDYTAVEADVFIYSVASGNHKDIFIYNDGAWIQITPIKAAKTFYLPPIEINIQPLTSTTTVNIYSEYLDQFSTPEVVSSGAPSQIHAYNSDELYYYVTSYDNSAGLISSVTIDTNGVMTINSSIPIISTSVLFNIVLVIK